MNKILLLGNSGAGKSTLAQHLSIKLNIPHLHLDTIVYTNDWHEKELPAIEEEISNFIKNDKWIIDGNFLNKAKQRFDDCDTIIFLDINRFVCLHSVIHRYFKYKGKPRDGRSDECDEKLTFSYINWVFFGYYIKSRKKIIKLCKDKNKNILIFKSRKQINKYIKGEMK